jgi:hypothetical protein
MSQRVLADLVGRTEDWLNKVENNRIQLDRISVIQNLRWHEIHEQGGGEVAVLTRQ